MRMSTRRRLPATALMTAMLSIAGCEGSESPAITAPASPSLSSASEARRSVCHSTERSPRVIEISSMALEAHVEHGDYPAHMVVDPSSRSVGDGVFFSRITDAVLAARAIRYARGEMETAACRIVIEAVPGTYSGSFDAGADASLEAFPLIIDVPDITLRGALTMGLDSKGRPTGVPVSAHRNSTLVPVRPLVFLPNTEAMIVVTGHPQGSVGSRILIEGFSFQSGRSDNSHGGMGIISLRARDLVIRGNRFERGLSSAADLRSSTALIERNYGNDLGQNCAFCLAGGEFTATGNRLLAGGLGGIYVSAALAHMPFALGANPVTIIEPGVLPASATVFATIRNNEIRNHSRLPIGFGVRILAIGPNSSQTPQGSHVVMTDNDLTANTFGLILDAGFPIANTMLRGDLDVNLHGNSITGSCQANLLVGFTRHTGSLGLSSNPYLRNSTYRITLGNDLSWAAAWFAHPAGLGNELIVDESLAANGIHHGFDSNECPGLEGG